MMYKGISKVGAGDLPLIPIEPIESFHTEEDLSDSHHEDDDKGRPIESQFVFHDVIGTGGFSKVRKATHKTTGETYAIKILDKSKMEGENFPRVYLEIETLSSLKHPSICKLYSAFYTTSKIYMVMEYCATDLFEYLVKLAKPLTESRARELFIQLLSAVNYLHSVGIAHRDIKPENILLTERMELRLSDFGFAAKIPVRTNYFLSTYCGSLAYCAPEVVTGVPYCGIKSDIWSLGVNLYVLLGNKQPFYATRVKELRTQIISGSFPVPRHFRRKSVNLIKRFLQVNPLDRVTLEEVWSDPWLREESIPKDFLRLYYSYHQHNFDGFGLPCQNTRKSSSSFWSHKPSCRSEPVQIQRFRTRRRIIMRRFLHSVRKNVSKFFCCKM